MTENVGTIGTTSIADLEREQAPQQARVRAVQALKLAGMPSVDADTVAILHNEFPQLRTMESLVVSYNRGVTDIVNSEETDMEVRDQAYEQLVQQTEPAFEQAATELQHAVQEKRRALQLQLFGHAQNTPLASPEANHARQVNYRDALYTASNAKDSELADHMELAEMTGDKMLMRAVAAIADKRGKKDLVYRYLHAAGEKTFEAYVRRNAMPTESTIGTLISAYRPERVARGTLMPNLKVIEAKRRREAQKSTNRARLYRGGR